MKSIIRNITTTFALFMSSSILFILFFFVFKSDTDDTFMIIIGGIIIGICSGIGLLGLIILSGLSFHFEWSGTTDYLIKIFLVIFLYIPAYPLAFFEWHHYFIITSLILSLSLITLDYKHIFTFNLLSSNKKQNNMEPKNFNSESTEFQPQNDSNYLVKGIILLIMGAILLVSTFFIQSLISDRENTKEQSQEFFTTSWGPQQTIAGPYLSIPYKNSKNETFYAYLMPKDLKVNNDVNTEKRKKGIFENIVYRNEVHTSGYFDITELNQYIGSKNLLLNEAVFCYGLTQVSSIDKVNKFIVSGRPVEPKSGLPTEWVSEEGLSSTCPIGNLSTIPFEIELNIKGTDGVKFLPLGKSTEIDISSNWDSPSFYGKYIPNERPDVGKNGFSAHWNIQHFNRSFPNFWLNGKYDPKMDAFGVDLKIPVNNYLKSERTVKYAILVIGLIFIIFFIIEINNKKNIHPIQYLLVGLSLCLFYGLLISISELISFDWAYLIAAIMTVFLISLYIYSVLRQFKFALLTGISLSGIYAFLYTILQQENYAFLLGNLGLFVILAIIMFYTRKINTTQN